jgi:hypothetical protein
MQDSRAYLEEGHHLDPPELQHLPESPTLNESCINKHQVHLKLAYLQLASVCALETHRSVEDSSSV